jgi:hypothetical protein
MLLEGFIYKKTFSKMIIIYTRWSRSTPGALSGRALEAPVNTQFRQRLAHTN